jgi:hypothetical protein
MTWGLLLGLGGIRPADLNEKQRSSASCTLPLPIPDLLAPRWQHSMRVLCVFAHAGNVNHDNWFLAHDPRIMSWRQIRDIPGSEFLFTPVIHQDVQPAGHMILQVRRLTTFGLDQRLDASGPFPAWLERCPAERDVVHRYQFHSTFVELSDFLGTEQAPFLHFFNSCFHNVIR